MAASSTMLELGTELPRFSLVDTVTGRPFDSSRLRGGVSVVAFLCNHCPYVKHLRTALAEFGRELTEKGVPMVAVSSNDVASHPEDGPREMAAEAAAAGYPFPYLFDESQAVALAFHAACTPEFYVFDRDGKLAYRGRFDASTPKNGVPITGSELRAAIDALLAGASPESEQRPSIGCSIKWKSENEPEYF